MENQIPPSNAPQVQIPPQQPEITPEILEAMKAQAKQMAIQQILSQRGTEQQQPPQAQYQPQQYEPRPNLQQPQVVYLRRNLTVAEFILIFAISCGIVVGGQTIWNFGAKFLPSIEIKVK
jgi:hypothetical protein